MNEVRDRMDKYYRLNDLSDEIRAVCGEWSTVLFQGIRLGGCIAGLLLLYSGFAIAASKSGRYSIREEKGIRANGKILHTQAIPRAMDKISEKGGGMPIFPAETYAAGTLRLRYKPF